MSIEFRAFFFSFWDYLGKYWESIGRVWGWFDGTGMEDFRDPLEKVYFASNDLSGTY